MRSQLEQRLKTLRSEFESGQKMLMDLETREASLRETLLRISGAIQVIEEELAKAVSAEETSSVTAPDNALSGKNNDVS